MSERISWWNFRMEMTSFTASTATSNSLSRVIDTILSLNLLVNSSSFPFSSSLAYSGSRDWRHFSLTSPTLS